MFEFVAQCVSDCEAVAHPICGYRIVKLGVVLTPLADWFRGKVLASDVG